MEFNTLTTTLTRFVGVFQGGYTRLAPTIDGILAALAGIDIVLIGFWWALGGGERLTEVIKKVLFLGFWLWFTHAFQSNAGIFVQSLINAGLKAGGQTGNYGLLLDPSRIAGYGLTATEQLAKALDDVSITDLGDALIFALSYLVIMAAFLIMAIQAFLSVLEYYLITAVAGVLVPWGLLPQTKFLAEKAIGAVVAAGIKLMVLAFIIAVASPVLATIHFSGPEIKLNELWSVILTTGAIAFLAWHVPSLAAGLLAGSPSLGASAVSQNLSSTAMLTADVAGTMVSATRAAAAGLAGAGSRVAYGAGRLAGGAVHGARAADGPLGTVLGAGRGAAGAAGRYALDGFKARLAGVAAPLSGPWRAGMNDAAAARAPVADPSPVGSGGRASDDVR
jgi:type IV secretion system protein TrbL